jgi:hypothetical protein
MNGAESNLMKGYRVASAAATFLLVGLVAAPARAEIEFEETWQPADYETVREEVAKWQAEVELDDEATRELKSLWPRESPAEATGAALLDRVAQSIAPADPRAADQGHRCGAAYKGPAPPKAAWLATPEIPDFARNNLRLYYARWLAQYGLYDEVLEQVADLQPADVIDPASLLFYQMAAYHQLVQPEEARAALVRLMEHEDALPRRFQQVAQLVQRDLSALEDESLDHIARRMRDVRRRLDYGRAGEKVQTVERGVLESLDKKIEDLEKQQQQQQQSASSGGSSQSSKPMEDSRPAELKAPMQVDRREIGSQSGWGDLPPKEREQALQQIGREFPAHYRELIEDYFRELANEPVTEPKE